MHVQTAKHDRHTIKGEMVDAMGNLRGVGDGICKAECPYHVIPTSPSAMTTTQNNDCSDWASR